MATLDLLDYFKPGYESYMDQEEEEHKRLSEQLITISPKYWEQYSEGLEELDLDWTEVKYTELNEFLSADASVANSTGVYIFLVRPVTQILNLPKFVYYVGIAGETDSGRPLRERLRDYIQVSQIKKRKRLHMVLKYYIHNTYVHYAELDATPAELRAIETQLHGFFYPWAGERDFPAPIKNTQQAWGRN